LVSIIIAQTRVCSVKMNVVINVSIKLTVTSFVWFKF